MPDVDDSNGSRASSVCGTCQREQVSSSWMVSVLTLLHICLLTDETRMTDLIIILYLTIATDHWEHPLHLQGLGLKVPA